MASENDAGHLTGIQKGGRPEEPSVHVCSLPGLIATQP